MFTPADLEVAMVSFEGPDQYSLAGGLGVRARDMCRGFASLGFATSLFFVGDPAKPLHEFDEGVRLVRWCQSVSRTNLAGVYAGEHEKVEELEATLPRHIVDNLVRPAAAQGRLVAVLCEEWQTATFCRLLHDELELAGLREKCVILWNANNHYGFDVIDWTALAFVAGVTTVSRYMKHLMWPHGVNPVVIPNGISASTLERVDGTAVGQIRDAAGTSCLLFKIGRFSADKRWHQALAAVAQLRKENLPARLVIRGGMEGFGATVLSYARTLGLDICDWYEPIVDSSSIAQALIESGDIPIINVCRFLPDNVVREVDVAATAVLANSGHEPFGLVGLEAMAAGAVAVVGATGEEYARPYGNAIVIETDDGAEVASAVRGLVDRPALGRRLRVAARRDAADFVWANVLEGLLERLRYICIHQKVPLPTPGKVAGRPRSR